MPTYLELKEQAEKLLAQAEQVRREELQQVIADIKARIQAYGLTAQDLGLAPAQAPARSGRRKSAPAGAPKPRKAGKKAAKAARPVRYRGPNGETWGGGRGRKPQWVVQALAQGRRLEEFEVR